MNKTLRGVTGPPQTSNMESFAIIVNGFEPLTIVAKLSKMFAEVLVTPLTLIPIA